MACSKECFDIAHPNFGYSLCSNCPGRDDGNAFPRCYWVISGGGYGAYLFGGTLEEAEEVRKHRETFGKLPAALRLATEREIVEDKVLLP